MWQEHIRLGLYAQGATDDTLLAHVKMLNSKWDAIFAQQTNGKLPIYEVHTV